MEFNALIMYNLFWELDHYREFAIMVECVLLYSQTLMFILHLIPNGLENCNNHDWLIISNGNKIIEISKSHFYTN